MFIKSWLYWASPVNCNVMYIFGARVALAYSDWRRRTRKALMDWHRKELCALDPQFNLEQAQLEIVRRREVAREQGIGAGDPRYPDLFDIIPFPEHD